MQPRAHCCVSFTHLKLRPTTVLAPRVPSSNDAGVDLLAIGLLLLDGIAYKTGNRHMLVC